MLDAFPLTLNLGDGLLEKLLLESRLGELSLDILSNSLDQSLLLGLSLLLLESDPRVEDRLELSLDGLLLLQSEVFVLDSVGLSCDGVELLSEGDDFFQSFDRDDSVLDGLLVFGLGGVELSLDVLA